MFTSQFGTLLTTCATLQYPKTLEGALFRDEDFCVCDEASPNSEGVYVDLYENPERFTGYAGPSANNVWKAIYEENCFDVVPFMTPSRASEDGGSGYVKSSLLQDASKSVRSLMGSLGLAAPRDPPDDEQCLEKRVYYRLISGKLVPVGSLRSVLTYNILCRSSRFNLDTYLLRLP